MQQAIRPIMRYPGSKWRMADWITQYLPKMPIYVEPYCGGASVYLNLPWKPQHAVLNDLNGDICNLFRVVRTDGERLAALIEMTPWAREECKLSIEPCDDPTERARRYLVRVAQSHSADGVRGTPSWATGPKRRGTGATGNRAVEWQQIPGRIRALIQRLRNADIENCDAIELIGRYACYPNALIYCDPPYVLSTRVQKTFYQYEMTDKEHAALLDTLELHPGPVAISGYAHDIYDDRLKYWTKQTRHAVAQGGQDRTEVLWINPVCVDRLGYGPLFAQETR
jgi:DNA adenine methylase